MSVYAARLRSASSSLRVDCDRARREDLSSQSPRSPSSRARWSRSPVDPSANNTISQHPAHMLSSIINTDAPASPRPRFHSRRPSSCRSPLQSPSCVDSDPSIDGIEDLSDLSPSCPVSSSTSPTIALQGELSSVSLAFQDGTDAQENIDNQSALDAAGAQAEASSPQQLKSATTKKNGKAIVIVVPIGNNRFQKRFKCTVPGCDRTFSRMVNLEGHQNATHLNVKPFQCQAPGCHASFARRNDRNRHFQTLHRSLYQQQVLSGDSPVSKSDMEPSYSRESRSPPALYDSVHPSPTSQTPHPQRDPKSTPHERLSQQVSTLPPSTSPSSPGYRHGYPSSRFSASPLLPSPPMDAADSISSRAYSASQHEPRLPPSASERPYRRSHPYDSRLQDTSYAGIRSLDDAQLSPREHRPMRDSWRYAPESSRRELPPTRAEYELPSPTLRGDDSLSHAGRYPSISNSPHYRTARPDQDYHYELYSAQRPSRADHYYRSVHDISPQDQHHHGYSRQGHPGHNEQHGRDQSYITQPSYYSDREETVRENSQAKRMDVSSLVSPPSYGSEGYSEHTYDGHGYTHHRHYHSREHGHQQRERYSSSWNPPSSLEQYRSSPTFQVTSTMSQ
ncbi:uncharacterized protein BJ171DRAFT_188066 [Polychytrium aggregatum]|uniref:uncharacterized protein n=1 Tax=Polychytrium aggregatum TaxID=110093 RepID=UPI0022FF13F6|nr:uncharacterized protein BJ171DRAFT_188066 [Polychytrium aggregatum]KAI9202250.1 hypothetical protein BJ171DRAFT_188066 [Polychytrium aggregatum]